MRLQFSSARDQFLPASAANSSNILVNFHIDLLQTKGRKKINLKKAFVFRPCLMDVFDTKAKIKHGRIKQWNAIWIYNGRWSDAIHLFFAMNKKK